MTEIKIKNEYITLTQALKEVGVISTGGQAKWYLQENDVQVNNVIERRRGKKLYPGDTVTLEPDQILKII
ncbi:S4 domain-containing protein YaaA [Bombilactobacillus bombi]|uniref:S4 domain-containing protein YaaA n=1 Tax=Bombilactobacillus bombi TaxID=1303590 RepID=A0A417ZCU5_9LACO|nr:S4 domain-containing protein YaaA [Bombilactobacillus bombi]RHW48520.1 S4 domain-containing protein YaaA [Bombilactobacillus bombi]